MTRAFSIEEHRKATVTWSVGARGKIDVSPVYQRQAGVWTRTKQQLFIDSLLNGFDIPKLYLHELPSGGSKVWAVVDGKQRLETIWQYIDDEWGLSDDNELFDLPGVDLNGVKFSALPPSVQARLTEYRLPVYVIVTEDEQWIEEMFARLNEAVALNAPERRNALGGPLPNEVRQLARHAFFQNTVPFNNNRYKHLDLAMKFLFLEHNAGPGETKRRTLDSLCETFKTDASDKEAKNLRERVEQTLDRLVNVFGTRDALLSSIGLVVVYFLLEREQKLSGARDVRDTLNDFDQLRRQVRTLMNKPESGAAVDRDLSEFERLSQSPNDISAMKKRMALFEEILSSPGKIEELRASLK